MTYCLGIKVNEGLIALADTRITSGTNTTSKKKVLIWQKDQFSLFIMTSGLRSVRDKCILYFKELLDNENYTQVYKAVNAFGELIRKVSAEDKLSLEEAGFKFDLNTIIGGQLSEDIDHKLFHLYPEGNWVELGEGAPFVVIGNSAHGKAILNRTLKEDSDMRLALKTGFLSFDSTRLNSTNVGFPIDLVIYKKNSFCLTEKRFEEEDLEHISAEWDRELKKSVQNISEDWMEPVISGLDISIPAVTSLKIQE